MRVLATLLLLLLVACEPDAHLTVSAWELQTSDAPTPSPVLLPADLTPMVTSWPNTLVLRSELSLPTDYRKGPTTLVIPELESVPELFIGDQPIRPMDDPLLGFVPRILPHRFRVPDEFTQRGTLPIRIHIPVNLSTINAARIHEAPYVSPTPLGGARLQLYRELNLGFLASSLVLLLGGTVFMFGAYVVLRETILHVLYAAACASATAYPAYVLGISQTIIGDRHGLVLGAATALGTWSCLSVVCMHARNKLAPKPWLYGSLVLLAASLLSTWPGFPVQHIHRLWAAFVLVGLGQMVWTLVDSLRTNFKTIPFNHQLSLLSWPVAIAVATPDVLNIVGLSRNPLPVRTVPITIFIIMIAEMVSRVLGRILVQMRANAELASRFDRLQEQHREIQVLNAELQRQVHEKAEGLSLALARMATQPDSERIKSGDLLDGRYKLGQVLGAGAMGTVFAARRLGDDKPVAVKLMNGTQSLEGRARLAREAQISTRIAHPHLVTVFDVSVSNEGDLYLVMELVNGPTLRNCTECYGPHLWSMRVLAQVAEGLAALHAVGTIHRDLKPANILLEHSDKPRIVHAKIADFGISTIRDAAHGAHDTEECLTLTRPGHLMGTPVYMAPEIFLDSHAVSPAVDIFSFGILAAELLSQQPPMANPPMGYVLHAVPEAPMIPLKSLCPSVTDPLGVLVDRCRQANPKLRPSALELRDAFLSAAEAYVTSARGIEMTSE